MQILVGIDQNPYSAHTVSEVARLAANTWANVTLLGLQTKASFSEEGSSAGAVSHPLSKALREYRELFLGHFKDHECPYLQREYGYELIELKKGLWEELYVAKSARKDLKSRIRLGNPVKELLAEAQEEESDLIVLGCDQKNDCTWEHFSTLPQKIANDAPCSVLVVKEESKVDKIVCCLDHDLVSQRSLEMINQLVTLHQAKLVIIGLTEGDELKTEVEHKMDAILRYYTARDLEPWIEIVQLSSLDAFIAQEAKWGLMALWMGKKSILEKVLPRKKVDKLIKGSNSSVLILR
ncbi:MAG: universal stress protein [Deltaproteobacteria bacterium]